MSIVSIKDILVAKQKVESLKMFLEKSRSNEVSEYESFIEEQIQNLSDALSEANIPESYRVAVVGRFKVGKSSFVNRLAGERLAGVHANPETAAISIFRYAETARAEIELVNAEDWRGLREAYSVEPKNPEVKRYERFITFNERLQRKDKEGRVISRETFDLTCLMNHWIVSGGQIHTIVAEDWNTKEGKKRFLDEVKKFTTGNEPLHYLVNKLTIYAPVPILKNEIELIDTPGLDDTEQFRVRLTEDLVKDVDAILFLTVSGASYSQGDKEFIVRQLRTRQIKHLQIIVTKSDETYENSVRDARNNDDDIPSYEEFVQKEIERVRAETKATLNELLQNNKLSDEDGYYYIEQLDNVPIHLVSTKYHDEKNPHGGFDAVENNLYEILSTSFRFEQTLKNLTERFRLVATRINTAFSERLNTIETVFNHEKVRKEIKDIELVIQLHLIEFEKTAGENVGLLRAQQEAVKKSVPLHLDLISSAAKEVLNESHFEDIGKHWRTRRNGGWGGLEGLKDNIADKTFPRVEALLNEFRDQLENYMKNLESEIENLQDSLSKIEKEHHLSGLDPISFSTLQKPLFESMRDRFKNSSQLFRDSIVSKMDDFVSQQVMNKLDDARDEVKDIGGRGTTASQSAAITKFYNEVKSILASALREHLDVRIKEFSDAILSNAESVGPRIKKESLNVLSQRLQAIETSLNIEASGQKERVINHLNSVLSEAKRYC